jgi:hypothetical protein
MKIKLLNFKLKEFYFHDPFKAISKIKTTMKYLLQAFKIFLICFILIKRAKKTETDNFID